MPKAGSVFLDFNLPNDATWLYFSLLLAVALFFKFSRLLSVRNWDVITVFLLVPGVLLIEDAQPSAAQQRVAVATLMVNTCANALAAPVTSIAAVGALAPATQIVPKQSLTWGYLWLV